MKSYQTLLTAIAMVAIIVLTITGTLLVLNIITLPTAQESLLQIFTIIGIFAAATAAMLLLQRGRGE